MSSDQPTAIRKGEALDQSALQAHLLKEIPGFAGIREIRQFPGGYSNLTYLLDCGEKSFVLRRPPFGANIKGAHDMGREYRVLSLLKGVYPKAPLPVFSCEDESVIGAPFYLMERVEGVILRASRPPKDLDLGPATMRALSEASIDNLVQLHSLDLEATGLGQLGKPEGYVQRQVEGWIRRYKKAKTDEVPAMDQLAAWMPDHMPAEHAPAFIHNDYKYDNLVLNPENLSDIRAVLDWEMATVGDPLMDLGTSLSYWVEEQDSPALKMFNLTALPGNLSRKEALQRYALKSGRDVSGILFYYVFSCFKLGVIVQQIYARYKAGLTQDPRFAGLLEVVKACGENGREALGRGGI